MTEAYQTEPDTAMLDSEINRMRQWFDALQDVNAGYLEREDYELAKQLYGILNMRVPNSIKDKLS